MISRISKMRIIPAEITANMAVIRRNFELRIGPK